MAAPDRSIDPRILKSAKKEFLKHGFEKTSLKAICDGAGITTGALYKRYKGKEDLFCAIVEDTVNYLYAIADQRIRVDLKTISDDELVKTWDMDLQDVLWWFKVLYERYDDFVLLLSCSEGTVYSNFQHDWVEMMTKATMDFLREAQNRNLCRKDVGHEELHILLTAFWASIYEPFIHGFSWEQIEFHCELICKIFSWKKAFAFRE